MRTRNGWQRIAGVALLFFAGGRGLAQGADLHLVQQFEIRQGTTTLLQEQRELFQQGNAVILRNPTHHFLIRGDLQRAWLLDADRQIVSEVPLEQLRREMAGKDLGPMPALHGSSETRTVLGLQCQLYRTATSRLTAEACVTRQFPALEKFRDVLSQKPEAPGIPLTFLIQIAGPDVSTTTSVQQRLLKVETIRLDPRLFAPPTQPATPGKPIS